jgi:hypothetical protein
MSMPCHQKRGQCQINDHLYITINFYEIPNKKVTQVPYWTKQYLCHLNYGTWRITSLWFLSLEPTSWILAIYASQLITLEHEILSNPPLSFKKFYKKIIITLITHCRYIPIMSRRFKSHNNLLQNSHLDGYSFSHTPQHFVLTMQHLSYQTQMP